MWKPYLPRYSTYVSSRCNPRCIAAVSRDTVKQICYVIPKAEIRFGDNIITMGEGILGDKRLANCRLKADGRLKQYENVADTPGFSRAITGVIAELRSAQVRSDGVTGVAPVLLDCIGFNEDHRRELANATKLPPCRYAPM
jgi:hypothetical protein